MQAARGLAVGCGEDRAQAEAAGAPPVPTLPGPAGGAPEGLLLFGEEAESLLLVLLAEAGVGASDRGQGQALCLDADALGFGDGGTHALQPGQHLLLQGGRVMGHRGGGAPRALL